MQPAVRGSTWFKALQQIVAPTPQEAIVADAMAYVAGSRLDGDYVEFGVSRGTMLAHAFLAAERHGLRDMRFYGFDSFEGMPEPEAANAGDQHQKGAFRADLAEFHQVMAENHVDVSRIEVVPGWFDDVLTEATKQKLGLRTAAVLAADCGSYGPTLAALHFATSSVQDGTVLLFGDWFSYRGSPASGQRRAFAEWMVENPQLSSTEFQRFGWHGQSFLLHLAPPQPS